MTFITFNTAPEFICFLFAVVFLHNDKDPAWKLFRLFMLLTCVVEISGIYLKVSHHSNYALYNIFLLFEGGFTSFFFFHLYSAYQYRLKWLVIWLTAFVMMYLTELLLTHFANFASVTAAVMSVVFVLACLYYYYLKLNDEAFEPLIFSAPFWWVNGALFFYFGSTVCNVMFDYMATSDTMNFYGHSIRYIIFCVLDVILYAFWSYAFLCRYLQRKSSY